MMGRCGCDEVALELGRAGPRLGRGNKEVVCGKAVRGKTFTFVLSLNGEVELLGGGSGDTVAEDGS